MTTLAEPTVLAAAKDALYPDVANHPDQYAVTETQFTTTTWGSESISPEIHERLQPFNSIRLDSGEPDLLGIGMPDGEVLNDGHADTPAVAIEAKGYRSSSGTVDVARGIEQAHSRLSEVNLGYVAAPAASVGETARALARELNVGIVGAESAHTATVLEPARITGAGEFSRGVEAIRFQARTNQFTAGSFPVNHPKNYLGYVLAFVADGETDTLYSDQVIERPEDGRRGAALLGLLDVQSEERLTHLGAEIVRFAQERHGSVRNALVEFDSWTRRSTRFTELAPRWAQLARSVTMQYEPTRLIVDALEALHADGVQEVALSTLFERACMINQPLAVEVCITEDAREDVLARDGSLDTDSLRDPAVYKSGLHFQYKAQLFHVGLVTERGTSDKAAVLEDTWRLEQSVGSY